MSFKVKKFIMWYLTDADAQTVDFLQIATRESCGISDSIGQPKLLLTDA